MWHIITVPWLSLDSQKDRHRIVKQIKLNDGVAISRKDPLTNQIINKGIKGYWNIQICSTDMLAATISLVGHDCLFRGQETFSGIQVKDVKWNLDQRIVTLHIGSPQEPGKVAQPGNCHVHIGDYTGPSGYKYHKCWFDVRSEVFVYLSSCAPSKFLSQGSNDFHRANQQEVVRATTLSYADRTWLCSISLFRTLSSSWWSYQFVCCRPYSSGSNGTRSLGNRHRIDLLPRQEPPSVQGRICFWHR